MNQNRINDFTDIVIGNGDNVTYGEIIIAFGEFMDNNRDSLNHKDKSRMQIQEIFYMREIMSNYTNAHREVFFCSRKIRLLNSCVAQAYALLNAKIRMIELKSQYPEADIWQVAVQIPESELYWNPDCGKRALMEIISALVYLTAFVDKDRKPAPFIKVIAHFERLLHIELPQPYKMRLQLLERKIKCTAFVDKMRNVLIENSGNTGI
jgi:hypothetical protein